MVVRDILSAHPNPSQHLDALAACIEACRRCEKTCDALLRALPQASA